MTEAELRELIRQTIEELLNPPPRRALVLFTGALLGFEDALDGLAEIGAAGVELDYVQTPSAARILDQDRIAAVGMTEVSNKLVREHQMLIVPTLTVNIAAKVAHGIGDCLASNLLAEFIMANRPVVAVESAATPDSPEKQGWFPNMPAGYAARLRRNLAELAAFGVRLCSAQALPETVLQAWSDHAAAGAATPAAAPQPAAPAPSVDCHRSLISHSVVQALASGTRLRVRPDARVTALAADAARARSIRIEKA